MLEHTNFMVEAFERNVGKTRNTTAVDPGIQSQRAGYQSKTKTTASLSTLKWSPQFIHSFLRYNRL